MGATPVRPRALVLNLIDNVAVAVTPLNAGELLVLERGEITLTSDIPTGHKFALREIAMGSDVVKYGEVIGKASAAITTGSHVHVHNVVSARLPGPARTR